MTDTMSSSLTQLQWALAFFMFHRLYILNFSSLPAQYSAIVPCAVGDGMTGCNDCQWQLLDGPEAARIQNLTWLLLLFMNQGAKRDKLKRLINFSVSFGKVLSYFLVFIFQNISSKTYPLTIDLKFLLYYMKFPFTQIYFAVKEFSHTFKKHTTAGNVFRNFSQPLDRYYVLIDVLKLESAHYGSWAKSSLPPKLRMAFTF